jgi:hypothetical protein
VETFWFFAGRFPSHSRRRQTGPGVTFAKATATRKTFFPAGDRQGLEKLLMYMLRHPFNPKAIEYNQKTGMVTYTAARFHQGRNTNRLKLRALDFISCLVQHIPHLGNHTVRYYGACQAKVRQRLGITPKKSPPIFIPGPIARWQGDWPRLLWKVYGHNPLECPKCGGERILVAVIMEDESLQRILKWMGLPTEKPRMQPARAPPPTEQEEEDFCQLEFEEYKEWKQQEKQRNEHKPLKTMQDLIVTGLLKLAKEVENPKSDVRK